MNASACFQINMAALDIRHVRETLPHQLRALGGQVAEIQFTLDTHHSRASRFSTENHAEKLAELRQYLEDVCRAWPKARIVDVDYSASAVAEVAKAFLGVDTVPKKAYDGSAFYAYLFGLWRSTCDFVFHADSDMLFGGGSQDWIAEAIDILEGHDDMLACNPLSGPPRADGGLTTTRATASDLQRFAFRAERMSSRVFILDRRRFTSGELRIPLVRGSVRQSILAYLYNTSPYVMLEECLSHLMLAKGLGLLDFLGSGRGLWSLHPPYRSPRFYAELPNVIRRVESGDVHEDQRGDYNVNDSMIDWSDVRREKTPLRRFPQRLRFVAYGLAERFFHA